MSISEREKLVLNAIINYYLMYGDTIGSRTLVKKYGIELSSATIRNVMADLEDLGYIEKTHTSSGRIPTDKGYKYYLSELLKVEKLTQEEKTNIELAYEQRIGELDLLLKKTSSLLSKLTNYAGIAAEPSTFIDTIKKIELVSIDDYTILAVIVRESGNIKTKKIILKEPISKKELDNVNKKINEENKKRTLTSIDIERIILGSQYDDVIDENNNFDNNTSESEDKFFIHNMPEIFKDKNVSEVSEVMDLFGNKNDISKLFEEMVKNKKTEPGAVEVLFGDELGIKGLEDYSFVYSIYKIGNSQGILGVIGPKRMAYSKTMSLIKHVSKEVNKVITNIENKNQK